MRRWGAVVAEMVDAVALEAISLAGECGFESRRPHRNRTQRNYTRVEEKGHEKIEARTKARNLEG